jgi:general secretion pathway protein G
MTNSKFKILFKSMKQRRQSQRSLNQNGFTLIEIILASTIFITLTVGIIKAVTSQQQKARYNQSKLMAQEILKALETYSADCGDYPSTEEGLEALVDSGASSCKNWGPEAYIKKGNLKDPWNNPFEYRLEGSSPEVVSYAADKKEGGTEFNKDIIVNNE